MDFLYKPVSVREADMDAQWEASRRRLEREQILLRRVETLERQVALLAQLLRTSGLDGLYSAELEAMGHE